MNLDHVEFRTPCTLPWDGMNGKGDQVRHCDKCGRNVYNLSALNRQEAEAFLEKTEGRECVKIWKRPDGTVVTADCAVAPPQSYPMMGVPAMPQPDSPRPAPPAL